MYWQHGYTIYLSAALWFVKRPFQNHFSFEKTHHFPTIVINNSSLINQFIWIWDFIRHAIENISITIMIQMNLHIIKIHEMNWTKTFWTQSTDLKSFRFWIKHGLRLANKKGYCLLRVCQPFKLKKYLSIYIDICLSIYFCIYSLTILYTFVISESDISYLWKETIILRPNIFKHGIFLFIFLTV